jgi:hypothetical protein
MWTYLWETTLVSLIQIGVFLGPSLVLAFGMNYESGFVQRRAFIIMGKGWYLGLFGWLGTIVHELSHAIFALVFRHKITAMKLFDPDPEDGTLGYVKTSYNPLSLYQLVGSFFIGIGPILLGTVIIYLLPHLLLNLAPFKLIDSLNITSSQIVSWDTLMQICQTLWSSSISMIWQVFSWHNLSTWQFYVFIYLAFAIGSCIRLSPADLKNASKGFGVILILIFIFNLATVWAGDFTLDVIIRSAGYLRVFYGGMFLILLLNIAVSILLLVPLSLLRSRHSKAG